MRRLPALAVAALVAGAFASTSFAAPRPPRAQTAARSAVQASGTEYHINLSRGSVKAGTLRVEFANFGEDDHDLAIKRAGAHSFTELPTVHPGDRASTKLKVRPGTYLLWCTIADHKALGMHARIKVVRSK